MLTTDDALRLSLVRRFEIEYEQRGDLLRPFPDAASTIAALTSHGVAVAVTTTKSRARLRADAAHCGLSSLVPHPVTADDVNARPPDPRLLEGALELLGVAATDAVAVGDSPEDLMASRAAGVTNAAALYGCCYSREELLRERPDVCLESLQGLVDLVLGGGDS
jgi:phosphoglycolate phosphatase-like HAD superfamily hydrolase